MNHRIFIKAVCLCSLGMFGYHGFAETVQTQSTTARNQTIMPASYKSDSAFPPGTFGGDDIQLKLDSQGKYSLTGGAVGKPVHGVWIVEKSGKYTLMRLISNNKKEDDWLFGIRSKDTLQSVDRQKLKVLDKALNINEDVGILTREK